MWRSPLFVYCVLGGEVMVSEPDYDRPAYGRQWGVCASRRPVGLVPLTLALSPDGGEGTGNCQACLQKRRPTCRFSRIRREAEHVHRLWLCRLSVAALFLAGCAQQMSS